jgi:hypothetical protein
MFWIRKVLFRLLSDILKKVVGPAKRPTYASSCDGMRMYYFDSLLGGPLDGSVVDSIDDIVGRHPVHGAAHRLSGAQHLLHHPGELPGQGIFRNGNGS